MEFTCDEVERLSAIVFKSARAATPYQSFSGEMNMLAYFIDTDISGYITSCIPFGSGSGVASSAIIRRTDESSVERGVWGDGNDDLGSRNVVGIQPSMSDMNQRTAVIFFLVL